MHAQEPMELRRLVLCNERALGRITVGLEAFFEFSFDLAEALVELEERGSATRTTTDRTSRAADSADHASPFRR